MHWKGGLAIALVAALVLGASGAMAAETYKIGAIFALTGPASSLGIPERNTALLIQDELNKKGGIRGPDGQMHPVQIIIYDTASEETKTVLATKKLIEEDKVSAIVGPTQSGESLAIVDTVQKAQIPLISAAASIKIVEPVKDRKWVFKTPQSDTLIASVLISFLKEKNLSKVAFLSVNNAFGDSGRVEFEKVAEKSGLQIVAREKFDATDKDITAQLTRLRGTDFQAAVVWAIPPAASIVTKNYRQIGLRQPLFQSHGVGNKAFIDLAGPAANGVIFPVGKLVVAEDLPGSDAQKSVLVQYAKDYEARFGPRSTFGGHAWDGLRIVLKAMEKAGSDRAKIRDAVEGMKEFVGISGVFRFSAQDHNGLDTRAVTMVEIKDGKWTLAR
ncbi:MAG: ABC transporter substrate-binding protein [Candidatus Tectomicrobia bacterium]|uniref:ABC transporter substrate-binding protein n=1 Tax=Tectimicrobiota bacterium TaxID=2528274 RepID=A0A932GR28_UNCTE|nr:ABC transporter substrate-binding protein [Candidatus Tectomicrobia bacterium]